MVDQRRYSYVYRQARARFKNLAKRNDWPCWLCHEPFDWSLDWRDPKAFTVDHVAPLATGGDILGTFKAAHRGCNSARGDGTRENRLPTSRKWL